MKKAALFIVVFILVSVPIFARVKTFPEPRQIIPLTELTPGMIKELTQGLHADIAVECKEGTSLPLQFLSHYGLFSMKLNPNLTLQIEKPCYLRFVKRKTYLSLDLVNWDSPRTFFRGKLDADLKINKHRSIAVLETNLVPEVLED